MRFKWRVLVTGAMQVLRAPDGSPLHDANGQEIHVGSFVVDDLFGDGSTTSYMPLATAVLDPLLPDPGNRQCLNNRFAPTPIRQCMKIQILTLQTFARFLLGRSCR